MYTVHEPLNMQVVIKTAGEDRSGQRGQETWWQDTYLIGFTTRQKHCEIRHVLT